jgi:hypothetical protein
MTQPSDDRPLTAPAQPIPATSRRTPGRAQFIVAVIVLAVAAVGLNAATQMLQLHFKKVPVPLRHELDDPQHGVAQTIGPWKMVSLDVPLDEDMVHALGTDKYVFRDYVDTRKVTPAELAAFEAKSAGERRAILHKLQDARPDAVMNVAVTYYTGNADTIQHVPEICYVADGYRPENPTTTQWPVASPLLPPGAQLPVRYISFNDQSGTRRFKRNVAYFFQTQGVYECVPLKARFHMQNLSQRETYFAKVELMTQLPDREKSEAIMIEFLSTALPEIERCLPDFWATVNKKQPQPQPAAVAR